MAPAAGTERQRIVSAPPARPAPTGFFTAVLVTLTAQRADGGSISVTSTSFAEADRALSAAMLREVRYQPPGCCGMNRPWR